MVQLDPEVASCHADAIQYGEIRFIAFDPDSSSQLPRLCSICQTTETSTWRKGEDGARLCNKLRAVVLVVLKVTYPCLHPKGVAYENVDVVTPAESSCPRACPGAVPSHPSCTKTRLVDVKAKRVYPTLTRCDDMCLRSHTRALIIDSSPSSFCRTRVQTKLLLTSRLSQATRFRSASVQWVVLFITRIRGVEVGCIEVSRSGPAPDSHMWRIDLPHM